MKNVFKYSLVGVMLSILVLSCEKYLDFDDEIKDSKIVLNAGIDLDSTFKVHLSRSLSVLENGDLIALENGLVAIYDRNGNLVEELIHSANGFYEGTQYPSDNEIYKVLASVEGYKSIEATDSIPPKVLISKIDTLGHVNDVGYSELRLTIQFDDTPEFSNFYKLEVYTMENVNGSTFGYPLAIRSDDVALGLSSDGYATEVFFEDQLFNGQKKQLVVYVDDTRDYDDYLEVRLTSLSESGYLYEKTYNAYNQNYGNPFAQPVIIYNNVVNGFGILKSQQVVSKEVSF
jgi:hypothetical protein